MPCRSRKEVYAVKKSLTGYFSAQYTDGRQAGRQAGRVKLCAFFAVQNSIPSKIRDVFSMAIAMF